jgi:hypothetical protein
MLSIIIGIFLFGIFIFLLISGGNYLLRNMVDHFINDYKENFENKSEYKDKNIELNDACSKLDLKSQEVLNFQTGTNIPLSQVNYSNYVGDIYIVKDKDRTEDNPNNSKYLLKKPLLLYDGIWKSDMQFNKTGDEHQYWDLTNGNIGIDGYWSDDLIRTNKDLPKNYIDKTAVYQDTNNKYFTYCNDTVYDVEDKEIECFPEIFSAGMPLNK